MVVFWAMAPWAQALLLKIVLAPLVFGFFYLACFRGKHLIGRFIRSPKVYDFLFRQRGHRPDCESPADVAERLFHERAVRARQAAQDFARTGGVAKRLDHD